MGGLAFADRYNVVRLSPEIYAYLLERLQTLLSLYFEKVHSPIPAPEKDSHGDIDFLAAEPKTKLSRDEFAKILGAVACQGNTPAENHFVIPHPDEIAAFVQLDVRIVDLENFEWELMNTDYGDLWNMLGLMLSRVGLTSSNTGLYLRIAEIEASDRKGSRVLLTINPATGLKFLGLDHQVYLNGFETREQLFRFAAGCRFFDRTIWEVEDMNSNYRTRVRKREMLSSFINSWIPAHPEVGSEQRAPTREEVLAEALYSFPAARVIYDDKLESWNAQKADSQFWPAVAAELPLTEKQRAIFARREAKLWITLDESGNPALRETPDLDTRGHFLVWKARKLEKEQRLSAWVIKNWEAVRRRARDFEKYGTGDGREGCSLRLIDNGLD